MRRYGRPFDPARSYLYRPGIYGLILGPRGVLLTEQDHPALGPVQTQLPGGGIDPGEHHLPALHREVIEETGWAIEPIRRLGFYRQFTYMPDYDRWAEKVCHIMLCRAVARRGPATEPGHRAIWLPFESAIERLSNKADKPFLLSRRHLLRG